MKANAKKLLALILAMVMCLSLAAPAMAAGADALAVQATSNLPAVASNTDTATVTDLGEGKGNYKVTDKDGKALATGNVKNTTQPSGVKVTLTQEGVDVIGQNQSAAVYTVAYDKDGYKGAGYVEYGKDSAAMKSILDVADSEWKELDSGWRVFSSGSTKYQVKGSVYQEPQGSTGLVKTYFKLNAVKDGDFDATTVYYFKNDTAMATITTADDMGKALAGAKKCDVYGGSNVTGAGNTIDVAKAALTIKAVPTVTSFYGFTVVNPTDKLTVKGTEGSATKASDGSVTVGNDGVISATLSDDATTGTFEVRIKDESRTKTEGKDIFVTNADEAKTILSKRLTGNTTIESVTAASGNYLLVTVKKDVTADPFVATASDLFAKNVYYFGTKPVLVDLSKEGFYKAKTKEGSNASTVAANTETLGPVIVRDSDVTGLTKLGTSTTAYGTASGFTVYESVKDLKFTTTDCKNAKSVPYVQVVVNPWNDDKQNKLVNEIKKVRADNKNVTTEVYVQSEAVAVTLARGWITEAFNTPNAAFVKKGTVEIEAGAHKNVVETVDTVPATCKEKGKKIIKKVCTDCNKVISETTEEIPVVTDPVEKNTKKVKDENGDEVEKMIFEDGETPATKHYYKKAVKTTTTVDGGTVITTEFYCNLGVLHETRTTNVKKVKLQQAGRWNFFELGDRNENRTANEDRFKAADVAGNMFGYGTLSVYDSDVEYETLKLNRKLADIPTDARNDDINTYGGDVYFQFGNCGTKNDDGTYTNTQTKVLKNVYATANSLPTGKIYAAKLTTKNIKEADHQCQAGSATFVVEIYEVDEKATGYTTGNATAAVGTYLEKNLANGKVVLKQQYSKDIVIRPTSNHRYDEKTGICDYCHQGREAVESAKFTADTVTVEDLTYTGSVVQPKVTVYDTQGNKLLNGIDYVLETIQDYKVGEYTITVKGIDDYAGNRVTVPFKIVAAPTPAVVAKKQTLKVSVAKKTFKVKNLKKKKASFTTKLSGAKTAVTWKSNNAKVTVKGSKKKATITVKKGTKKGTYKVTATAKKTSAYKKGTVTIKVVVK